MKEEDASSERRRRELLPLGIHRRKVSRVRVCGLFRVREIFFFWSFFPKKNTCVFSLHFCKTSQFFFSKTNKILLLAVNARTTTKESTFEKSGEREDGFEGTREEEPVLCSRIR